MAMITALEFFMIQLNIILKFIIISVSHNATTLIFTTKQTVQLTQRTPLCFFIKNVSTRWVWLAFRVNVSTIMPVLIFCSANFNSTFTCIVIIIVQREKFGVTGIACRVFPLKWRHWVPMGIPVWSDQCVLDFFEIDELFKVITEFVAVSSKWAWGKIVNFDGVVVVFLLVVLVWVGCWTFLTLIFVLEVIFEVFVGVIAFYRVRVHLMLVRIITWASFAMYIEFVFFYMIF